MHGVARSSVQLQQYGVTESFVSFREREICGSVIETHGLDSGGL
jgi:hypothetical protein